MNREEIIKLLDERGIEYRVVEHRAVYTIAELDELPFTPEERSAIAKNLFLRDDKKRNYYLLSIRSDYKLDLKALRVQLSSRPLSFASEDELMRYLALEKGHVSTFGALNDIEHKVKVYIDASFKGRTIGIHPNDNRSTIFLNADALASLLIDFGEAVEFLALQ